MAEKRPDEPDPPEEADSAGVYFVTIEDFEWRPPAKNEPAEAGVEDEAEPATDDPEKGDASDPTD